MTRRLAVLRPEPGNAATVARIEASGLTALRLPLFVVRPITWDPPDAHHFDALLLTSANAIRHTGPALETYGALPVHAVGEATAAAARAAGLTILTTGDGGVDDLLRRIDRPAERLLHLTGREHRGSIVAGVKRIVVYGSDPLDPVDLSGLPGTTVLLHSPRAAARLADLAAAQDLDRRTIRLAAISNAALASAGAGWGANAIAVIPTDAALIDAAVSLGD